MSTQSPARDNSGETNSRPSPTQEPQPINAPTGEPATAQQLTDVERQMTGFERATINWARIAVLMSFLAALFVCLQWVEMRSGSADTHTLAAAAKTQAEKMQSMSDAAEKIRLAAEGMVQQEQRIADKAKESLDASNRQGQVSLDATKDAMRLDQRAWVAVKGFGPPPEIDKPWNLSVVFTNTGKTPAKQVRFACSAEPVESESALNWIRSNDVQRPALMSPNELQLCILHPTPLPKVTQELLDALKRSPAHIYVYGVVGYEDIFSKSHWLTFCSYMGGDGQTWDSCSKGNDTGDGKIAPAPFDKMMTPN